jgi:putative NADH-flavin reductase
VKKSGVKRLLVVGGAGSLYVAPGVQLVDTPSFPAEWKQGALAARDALNLIRAETTLDWTFLSPPVFLEPGARTGGFRIGGDEVLMAGDKPAGITVADLAVAIVDEIETPRHVRSRFTVGY